MSYWNDPKYLSALFALVILFVIFSYSRISSDTSLHEPTETELQLLHEVKILKNITETFVDKYQAEELRSIKTDIKGLKDYVNTSLQNLNVQMKMNSYVKSLESFQEALDKLPWDEYEAVPSNSRWPKHLIELYQDVLNDHLSMEDLPPPTVLQRPIPLSQTLNCSNPKYSDILTGVRRNKIPKIFDLALFGAEMDILETRLYELNDSVDYFSLVESTHSHRGSLKPLFLEKNYQRYEPFHAKMIHLVADSANNNPHIEKAKTISQDDNDNWEFVAAHRRYSYEGLIRALGGESKIDEDDLFITSDLDEIPDGDALYHVKYCEVKDLPFKFNMHFYRFNYHFITPGDTVIGGTVFNKRHFNANPNLDACRKCENRLNMRPLGAHISYFAPPAYMLWKQLTAAEGGSIPIDKARSVEKVLEASKAGKRICCPSDQMQVLSPNEMRWIPWWQDLNRDRFPYLWDEKSK